MSHEDAVIKLPKNLNRSIYDKFEIDYNRRKKKIYAFNFIQSYAYRKWKTNF